MDENNDILSFMNRLGDRIRPLARQYFRTRLTVDSKADHSPVTIADREIEKSLRAAIAESFPEDGIFGEEGGRVRQGSPCQWVIDPIDGTKAFISGSPLFGCLLARLENGRVLEGMIDMPALNERWTGDTRHCLFNGQPCHSSDCTDIGNAILYTTSPDAFTPDELAAFERVSTRVAFRRFGGDCYIYGQLAAGFCDLVIEAGLQPYDYLALVAVIEGAGGIITDWEGRPLGLESDGRVIAAATPALHAAALKLLR